MSHGSRQVAAVLAAEPPPFALRDRELAWRGNPDYPEHDRLGFRNPGVPRDAAIVTLGDSQTYGSKVGTDQAWPRQLGRLEQDPVYNMAFPGWGPLQSLLMLDEALSLDPEVVVVSLYAGNDLVDAFTFVYHRKRLAGQFRSEDPALEAAFERAEETRPWDGTPLADQDPSEPRERRRRPPDSIPEFVEEHSKLFGLWRAIGRAYDYHRRRPYRPEQDQENDPLKDDDYLLRRTASYKTVLTPSYRLPALDLDDPRVAEGLRITFDAREIMQQRCADAGVQFAVVLIPTKETALGDIARGELKEVPTEYAELLENELTLHRLLRERLEARAIPCVDTLAALRNQVGQQALPYSDTKDGHLNPVGHRVVAQLVDAVIDSSGS